MPGTNVRSAIVAFAIAVVVIMSGSGNAVAKGLNATAASIRSATSIEGGLCVYLGCENTELLKQLHNNQRILVHGLSADSATVENARLEVLRSGLYGLISIEQVPDYKTLPHVDGLVNLIVIDDLKKLESEGLDVAELLRVLAPGGKIATSQNASLALGKQVVVSGIESVKNMAGILVAAKAQLAGADDWTHWNHSYDGNAYSSDVNVAPPTHLKWTSGDEIVGSKAQPTFAGMRIVGNRVVYGHIPPKSTGNLGMYCRDAQSGVLLWSITTGITVPTSGGKPQLAVDNERVYFCGVKSGPVHILKLSDGTPDRTISDIQWTTEEKFFHPGLLVCDGKLLVISANMIWVYSAATGSKVWSVDGGTKKYYFPAISKDHNLLFAIESSNFANNGSRWPYIVKPDAIVAFDLSTGAEKWRNTDFSNLVIGQLVYHKNSLGAFGSRCIGGSGDIIPSGIGVLEPATGKKRWVCAYSLLVSGRDGSTKTQGYSMAMKDDFLWVSQGEKLLRFAVADGSWKKWSGHIASPDIGQFTTNGSGERVNMSLNQRCGKGVLTANYAFTGYGSWLGYDNKFTFKAIRRGACAEPPYPAQGNLYFGPATCGCIPELNGGKGYLALSSSGARKVADSYEFFESSEGTPWKGQWFLSGKLPDVSTSVLRKTSGAALTGVVPSGWPERSNKGGLVRKLALHSLAIGEYVFVNHGSELRVDILSKGALIGSVITGGRVTVPPVIDGIIALIGSSDGYLYGVNLHTGKAAWRFRAAPEEQRVIVSNQLESSWPIVSLSAVNGTAVVKAGRHGALSGGYYIHTVKTDNGELLGTEREHIPQDGLFADPEKGFSLFEAIPTFDPAQDGQTIKQLRKNVKPEIRVQSDRLIIDFGKGAAVEGRLRITNMLGEELVSQKGILGSFIHFPLTKFANSRYVITVESGNHRVDKAFSRIAK